MKFVLSPLLGFCSALLIPAVILEFQGRAWAEISWAGIALLALLGSLVAYLCLDYREQKKRKETEED